MRTKLPRTHLQGEDLPAEIDWYFSLCHLKHLYRQGWLQRGVSELLCESVAEHTFSVALLAMLLVDCYYPELDPLKVLRLCLLHDLGEIDAGDITPENAVPQNEKRQREIRSLKRLLRGFKVREQYVQLWEEYDQGHTPEAAFVRQVEKLEMTLQASVYESHELADLADFFASAKKEIHDPRLRRILDVLQGLRNG